MASSSRVDREMEEVETHRPATPVRHLCSCVVSPSDRSRSPDPRDPEEGGLVVEVELVLAYSGRPLAYKTFSMPKDRGSALGSLIAMGAPYETDKDKKYSYFFSLEDGRIIHCEENMYRKIFDYAWDLKAIPMDPTKHNEDDLVFSLVLQQVVREKDDDDDDDDDVVATHGG